MKITGVDPNAPVVDYVLIPRGKDAPLKLKIRALPLGADEAGAEIFPVPVPPLRPVPDGRPTPKGGSPTFLFDQDNKLVLRPDPKDAEYMKASTRRTRGFGAYILVQGLKLEPSVSFDADPALLKNNPAAYYLAVADELNSSGLALGDTALIIGAIMQLSNMDPKAIQKAREDFFLAEAAGRESVA